MPIFSTGLNHTTASIEIREKLAFSSEQIPEALSQLRTIPGVEEAVVVSTCNRTELYCIAESVQPLIDWLAQYHGMKPADLEEYLYTYEETAAIRHLLRVSAGLDSMVIGEPQILGQIKQAYETAQRQGATGKLLSRLFQHNFATAKRVRTETDIGTNPVSIASIAVDLAKRIFADFPEHTAMLIGAGETIELVARHLRTQGLGRMIIANRSPGRAQQLASQFQGYGIGLHDLGLHLSEADIIISSTASNAVLVTYDMMCAAIKRRKHRPVFIVDLAVPRDIDAKVADLDDVYLYSVDDLKAIIDNNMGGRMEAARMAELIIEDEVDNFAGWLRARDAMVLVQQLRSKGERIKREALMRATQRLANGENPNQVLDYLAHTLTNHLLHVPSARLRQAGRHGEHALLEAAIELFLLSDTKE